VARLCLNFFLLMVIVTIAGCGGGEESRPRNLYTRIHRLDFAEGLGFSMALDSANNIYAYAPSTGGVIRFVKQSSGQYTSSSWVAEGAYPIGVSPVSGRLFLQENRQIKVYDSAGQFIAEKPLDFLNLTVSNRGEVFTLGGGVVRLDEDGNERNRFNLGRNYLSATISADPDGNVAVLGEEDIPGLLDSPLILRVYSPEGTLLRETVLDERGFPFEFNFDTMTIGADGRLYVTISLTAVSVFDYETGKWLGTQSGLEDASSDIAVDASGTLYIMGGFQISIYKPNS
jgi:hypothetical protein